jgi:TPR repeat protein
LLGRAALGLLFGVCFLTEAEASDRLALVVGNSSYLNVQSLPNPLNDSKDVAESFERLGFSVTRLADATLDELRVALRGFSHAARDAEIAVVYFAGHGIEVGGTNWLIPIDAALKSDTDIDKEAVSLDTIMRSVSDAHFALIILDACRNNPFATKMERTLQVRAVSRGLARVRPQTNMLVAYAARDGTTANDGIGRNSPFTAALLNNLETPGLEIDLLFRRVRDRVRNETNGQQQPFTYGALGKQAVYLKAPSVSSLTPAAPGLSLAMPSSTDSAATCDRLAASPFDKDRPSSVPGIDTTKLDGVAALTACEAAVLQHPQVARFPFQLGRAAMAVKSYERARELFERASGLGSSMAMYDLGVLYRQGLGFEKDTAKAIFWFNKSVDLGNTHAMAALGLLYAKEADGTDDGQARRLFEQAVADAEPIAMNGLGVFYETGRDVKQDYAAAREWYQKASDLGNEVAMRNLGSLYERGLGAPKDMVAAKRWYEKAAAAGDQESRNRLQALK